MPGLPALPLGVAWTNGPVYLEPRIRQASGFDRKPWKRRPRMEAATTEMVQGVTLEAIVAAQLPDTESLLGELGSMYPVLTYTSGDLSPSEEE
jgi:hypothetical protein